MKFYLKTLEGKVLASQKMKSLPQAILGLLLIRGFNGSEIARELGVSRQAVFYWRRGLRKPAEKYLKKLLRMAKMPLDMV